MEIRAGGKPIDGGVKEVPIDKTQKFTQVSLGKPPEQEENRCPEHQEREEWLEDEEASTEYHECLFSGLFSGLKVAEEMNQLLDELCGGYTELSGAKRA